MVSRPNRLLQHLTTMSLINKINSTKSISPTKSYLNDAVDLDLNSVLDLNLVEFDQLSVVEMADLGACPI